VAVLVAIPLVLRQSGPDLQELYANQDSGEFIVPADIVDPQIELPGSDIWLGFFRAPADGTMTESQKMIRLGMEVGALQILALSDNAPDSLPETAGQLMQQLGAPESLISEFQNALDWSNNDRWQTFLEKLRRFALEQRLIAELHYGIWLEKLFLYLSVALEELVTPEDFPGQARKILTGIDQSALDDAELDLLRTIGDISVSDLVNTSDSRLLELRNQSSEILRSYLVN
jgi:hypothetical protein